MGFMSILRRTRHPSGPLLGRDRLEPASGRAGTPAATDHPVRQPPNRPQKPPIEEPDAPPEPPPEPDLPPKGDPIPEPPPVEEPPPEDPNIDPPEPPVRKVSSRPHLDALSFQVSGNAH